VSDYDAWVFMSIRDGDHPYAKTVADAAVLGIKAGLDQEGGGNGCVQLLPQLVKNGTVGKDAVETAFRCDLQPHCAHLLPTFGLNTFG
jgi:hypothetical protein